MDTNNYTKVMERNSEGDGDNDTQGFPLSAYYCTPFQALLVHVSQPKALVTTNYNHVVIITNICVDWREKQ
jgi:hypothetical protein